jgi:hypoxanthine phosphoribosyltransferase
MNVLLPADRIQERVEELAAEIAVDYAGKPLVIVGVLNGCLMFLADLVRHLDHPLRIGFIQASSYRGDATTAGELRFGAEILPDLGGCDVLLLDDILDTGQTLSRLSAQFKNRGVASLKTGVFVRKIGRQTVPLEPDYVGFEIPDKFVIGYGLDYNDEYRHLPFLAELPGG